MHSSELFHCFRAARFHDCASHLSIEVSRCVYGRARKNFRVALTVIIAHVHPRRIPGTNVRPGRRRGTSSGHGVANRPGYIPALLKESWRGLRI